MITHTISDLLENAERMFMACAELRLTDAQVIAPIKSHYGANHV